PPLVPKPIPSLDHLIRPVQHRLRNCQAKLLRSFQIDHQLELGGLLYRQISELSALQNLVHIRSGASVQVNNAHAVAHKSSVFHILRLSVHRRQPVFYREVCNLFSLRNEDWGSKHEDCVSASLACLSECTLNILGTQYVQILNLYFERPCGKLRLL